MTDRVNGTHTEVKKYAMSCEGFDFGILTARNQLVQRVINPLLDTVELELKHDHIVGSETRYTLKILIESERPLETVQ